MKTFASARRSKSNIVSPKPNSGYVTGIDFNKMSDYLPKIKGKYDLAINEKMGKKERTNVKFISDTTSIDHPEDID